MGFTCSNHDEEIKWGDNIENDSNWLVNYNTATQAAVTLTFILMIVNPIITFCVYTNFIFLGFFCEVDYIFKELSNLYLS